MTCLAWSTAAMQRRDFLALSLGASAVAMLAPARAQTAVRLTLRPEVLGNLLPADFTGLSYETAQLADPRFFSGENTQLAGFLGALGPGVLRIGGNTSEYAMWTPEGGTEATPVAVGPDTGTHAPKKTAVTKAAIRNLRDFLDATGWSLIYSLNFGKESPETMADCAAFIVETMGSRLEALQFGNEPDLFMKNGVRTPDYDYVQFAAEWAAAYKVVKARVPGVAIAGPDTATENDWLVSFAKQFQHEAAFLTHHYYAEGPPGDPRMTIEHLLDPANERLVRMLEGIKQARAASGLALRLAEGNSCYGGGKPGVSDSFASALWGGDLMYQLAVAGADGMNFHGGGYGWYAPIVGTLEAGFVARPLYYGMTLFAMAGSGTLVDTKFDTTDRLLRAYGLKSTTGVKAVLFNQNADSDARITIDPGMRIVAANVTRLIAPRLDDTTDITLGGVPLGANAAWQPPPDRMIKAVNGTLTVDLPKASAALVTFV